MEEFRAHVSEVGHSEHHHWLNHWNCIELLIDRIGAIARSQTHSNL